MIFAIYAGGYSRWFGADEVDYKFIDLGSFDAVVYSIMRISQGGTCLVDVLPQYGCYGEFFRPLWSVVVPSVKAITGVFFVLYLVSIFAAMRFASRVIHEPAMILLCGISLVALSCADIFFDPYFQYWPLRTVFPCLALWLASAWQSGPNGYKAFALGAFSALAISWNLDSGVPVLLSLAILIGLSGSTQASSLRALLSGTQFLHLGSYGAGLTVTLAILFGYLSFRAGAIADPSLYFHFQHIFYISGYLLLPIPPLPHPWGAVVLIMLLGLAAFAVRALRGRAEPQYELIGYAAILAVGVFVYYTGRSHIRVLVTVSWLPLILAFCLTDRMVGDSSGKAPKLALRWISAGGAVIFVAAWVWYYGRGIDDRWTDQLDRSGHAAPLVADAGFIAAATKPNDKVAILASSQGSLALTAGRTLDLLGTGMVETILWSEAKQTMQGLRDHGPENLFLDPRIYTHGVIFYPVFSAFERDIRATYVTRDWAPNGRLLHLVRRHASMDRDKVPFDRPPQVEGGRGDFPLLVTNALIQPVFQLELKIIADRQQAPLAILASSIDTDSAPFRGFILYHLENMGPDQWVLAIGNGSAWKITPPFEIPAGHITAVTISYSTPKLDIAVDGKPSFHADNFAVMMATQQPLYLGDWLAHMFRPDNVMDLPNAAKFKSPNYLKIQDRRFNGEIVSARLLP